MTTTALIDIENRKKLYTIVQKYAGSHFREIQRISKIPPTTLRHHLHYLLKHNIISATKQDNKERYFPNEFAVANKQLMGYLRQKTTRKILLCVLANKPCYFNTFTTYTNKSNATISWHLSKLQQQNIINAQKKGKKTQYSITINNDDILALLITYKATFYDTLVDNVIAMWELE